MIDLKKQEIQEKAVSQCMKNVIDDRFRGTCEIATGTGKTFIAFWMIVKLNPKSVIFLAEVEAREDGIKMDAKLFEKYYGINPFENRTVEFACYQSAYKWTNRVFDMVIADEIHDSLTPSYFEFYKNNYYKHLLGLSATIDSTKYLDEDGNEYTKLTLLNKIAPVVFKYTLSEGIANNTSRKLNIIIIKHQLDRLSKNIPVTYKDKSGNQKTFYQTEFEIYDYYNKKFLQAIYQKPKNEFLIRTFTTKRNAILYKAKSKMDIIKKLLAHLSRTIVFGNDIDSISSLIPTVSSRNTINQNRDIIESFNNGSIDVIGSFKMLKQGVNLKGLDNVILHSYYGVEKDALQRIGRLRQAPTDGFVFIILTMGTQEQVWFNKMINPLSNVNTIWCENVDQALNVWKSLKQS